MENATSLSSTAAQRAVRGVWTSIKLFIFQCPNLLLICLILLYANGTGGSQSSRFISIC